MSKKQTALLVSLLGAFLAAFFGGELGEMEFSEVYLPPLTVDKWAQAVTASPQEQDIHSDYPTYPPPAESPPEEAAPTLSSFSIDDLPAYSGFPYTIVHGNEPYFTEEELSTAAGYEYYAPLDDLGRCGVTMACVGPETVPTQERGAIGQVKPTGWQTVKYDIVDGKYLYNRCHLMGYQLTGENANRLNLITGTRALNVEGMLPFENMVADYVEDTGNHVLYRVTPIFIGDELLARGVLMEGRSVEDEQILFCVYAFNAQPGVDIDYATGESSLAEE